MATEPQRFWRWGTFSRIEIYCRKADASGDVCCLSDFADQSMPFVGPWREGGIAKQPIEFQFRDLVAFAGSLPQSLVVENRDVPPPIADKPGFLQGAHHIGDRGSPHAQHHPQEFMGEQKVAGWHPVAGHQQPAATALLYLMQVGAGG